MGFFKPTFDRRAPSCTKPMVLVPVKNNNKKHQRTSPESLGEFGGLHLCDFSESDGERFFLRPGLGVGKSQGVPQLGLANWVETA